MILCSLNKARDPPAMLKLILIQPKMAQAALPAENYSKNTVK